MPLSEADQRTVLLHIEVIRTIIRGARPSTTGDVVEVANGYVARLDPLGTAVAALLAETEEPDLDAGLARQAAETASRISDEECDRRASAEQRALLRGEL